MTIDTARPPRAAARPPLGEVAVGDLMHPGVLSCAPDTPVADVARMMARHRIHAVVVEGAAGGAPWGIVTDLDLVGRLEATDALQAPAVTLAATPAIVVAPGDPVTEAARLMHDYDVHHLVVVSPSRAPIGVLSTLDVVAAMAV